MITEEQKAYIKKNFNTQTDPEIASKIGATVKQIKNYRIRNNLKKYRVEKKKCPPSREGERPDYNNFFKLGKGQAASYTVWEWAKVAKKKRAA